MGNRVKGKPKPKSYRAALSGSAGTKQKLTRLGKKQKKYKRGLAATYIGRAQCLKRLQLDLPDFRRLCILKGIYPRLPFSGKTPQGKKSQSFYHIHDLKALAHEPLLERFREFKAFMKKVRRSAGRFETSEALRRNQTLPTYTLFHLVKERYPRFRDAIGELDDALTLVYLFAALPCDKGISAAHITKAKTLAAAWGAYCASTASITKTFISVKGVYVEAQILAAAEMPPVRWICPHAFTQFLPDAVDYTVMLIFLEFYETLLGFVLYKLYSDVGVRYPLPEHTSSSSQKASSYAAQFVAGSSTTAIVAANLKTLRQAFEIQAQGGAITQVVAQSLDDDTKQSDNKNDNKNTKETKASRAQKKKELAQAVHETLQKLPNENDDNDDDKNNNQDDDDDEEELAGPLKQALTALAEHHQQSVGSQQQQQQYQLSSDALQRKSLFRGLVFFLSREVPRGYLELVCLAFGGQVGWEGGPDSHSPILVDDPRITHHIVDRPKLTTSLQAFRGSREFVQPQWILDCANFRVLLPMQRYAVGATLPPHLSPWVDHAEEGYKPAYAEEIERYKNGETLGGGNTMLGNNDDQKEFLAVDKKQKEKDAAKKKRAKEPEEEKEQAGSDDDEDDDDEEEEEEDEEEAMKPGANDDENDDDDEEEEEEDDEEELARRRARAAAKEEKEAHELAKSMMSRKAAHLYGRMQHGLAAKKAKSDELLRRRQELEGKQKDAQGKTVLKQKVERLRKERKEVENTYADTGGSMKKSKKKRKSS